VLKLIFTVSQHEEKFSKYLDRYYKTLYEILLIKEVMNSKYVKDFLRLLLESLVFDKNITRIAAFLKRMLQISLLSEPSFIVCILLIVSQIIKIKHKLWKLMENKFSQQKEKENYDYLKRDPQFTNAEEYNLNELLILCDHYHPSVQKFSQFIIDNYNKEVISYNGDPLMDFSLVNFLEKFMLKNPKLKSKKKKNYNEKNKVNREEEELKKFLEDDIIEDDENYNGMVVDNNEDEGGERLDFIKRFNDIERVKSDKLLQKKNKKKLKNKSGNIEDFADQVMDEEYEKLDGFNDEDEDEDEDLENEGGDQNGNENDGEDDYMDDEDNGDFDRINEVFEEEEFSEND
jgi:ribosome biogenesis protein MAK21